MKKVVAPADRRAVARGVSQGQTCALVGPAHRCWPWSPATPTGASGRTITDCAKTDCWSTTSACGRLHNHKRPGHAPHAGRAVALLQ